MRRPSSGTPHQIFDRLVEGHDARDISYSMVRLYVKERRRYE